MIELEIKILDGRLTAWGFPRWGSALAAGLDLHACLDDSVVLRPGDAPRLIPAGFAMRIGDPAWCGVITPRSGLGHRGLVLGNTVGIIDADYEGPIMVSAWNRNAVAASAADEAAITVAPGDRIAQLVFMQIARPSLKPVEAFSQTGARGGGGFGSTGIGKVSS